MEKAKGYIYVSILSEHFNISLSAFQAFSKIPKQPQDVFTCSKSKIETSEQSVKSLQCLQQKHKNMSWHILVSLLLILNIFQTFSSVYVADFQQVNVCWDITALDYTFHILFCKFMLYNNKIIFIMYNNMLYYNLSIMYC